MAKAKKTTKSTKKPVSLDIPTPEEEPIGCCGDMSCCGKKKPIIVPIIIALLVIIVAVLAVNKGMVVAAIVNGKPVFRWELSNMLTARFGKQTLEAIVSERLIAEEASKARVSVTQKDIDAKEEEIIKSFGGKVTLDDMLKFQGMTKSDFDSQVKLQLLVSKLLEKDITVESKEIDDYIAQNKTSLVASNDAEMKEEAKKILFEQKVSEKIQPWFAEIKAKAKILRFL